MRTVAGNSTVVARSATKFSKNSYNKKLPSVPTVGIVEEKEETKEPIAQVDKKSIEEKIFYYDCSVYMYTIRRSQRGYVNLFQSYRSQEKLQGGRIL
eukprot:TRINITY_DN5017_c0_g1_i1.p1 TRINITY_DN5017_c0_g1~~TRINITY_DN5017_c0_g1_i1.p1  ORF type:complete len:97 (+),score=18.10 TRINITY_DN5017_c0_g1_i1:240-530(+)